MRKTASIIRPSSWETTTNATTFFAAILALAFALPVGGWVVGACTAVATAFAARHLVQAIRERRTWTGLGVSFPIFAATFMVVQMPLYFE